jgi:two-component system sensor histidine kinase/response regulator
MSAKTPQQAQTKLLVVDDREENLLALEALLRREDVTVLTARSGQEALELLLTHDVALALLDVQMPEMDGFELAELMRGSGRTQSVPIIFVTAGSRDSQRVFRGYDAGAVDFLYKPIEPHILRNKVETFVQLDRQRRQLADQLERLSETLRLNEMFTAVLGHDLRNPLHAISTMSSVLRASSDPHVRDSSQRLATIAMRMSRMIDDMLDLARARLGGGIPIHVQEVELSELIARTVEEVELAHNGCVIAVDAQGDLQGTWDSDRLVQMISNLLGNALQHGTPNTPIILDADGREPHRVSISITSEGAIPDAFIPQLFDPFRSGSAPGRRSQGLGLGLFIVQQIATAHGGTVDVRSSEADGTTFTVVLPRISPVENSRQSTEPQEAATMAEDKTERFSARSIL